MSEVNPISSLSMEVRISLENWMKGDYSNNEILVLFNEKFPYIKGITEKNIANYRRIVVPKYQKMIITKQAEKLNKASKTEEALEKEILQQVKFAEEAGEEFNKPSNQKIEMLKAYRVILAEMWNNYTAIKDSDDESQKRGYLVEIIKALTVIKELEHAEKSLLTALAEVRAKEQEMKGENYLDHIKGWVMLRMCERYKSKEKAIEALDNLKVTIDIYKDVIGACDSCDDANKIMLEKIYDARKKSIAEVKEDV